MNLWIVIPTYNEKENINRLVPVLFKLNIPWTHILVVDDNSPDGTGDLVDQLGKQFAEQVECLHRPAKQGIGPAYLQGFAYALSHGADRILQMDADFSHPAEKIPELIERLETADLVIGSRYVSGGSLDENWATWRKQLSGFGNAYARSILKLPIKDVTGGFKLWKRSTLERVPLERVRSNGYIFQVEMNYIAYRLGMRLVEIPINFTERQWGESKMSFHIQREAALEVWQLPRRYRDLRSRG